MLAAYLPSSAPATRVKPSTPCLYIPTPPSLPILVIGLFTKPAARPNSAGSLPQANSQHQVSSQWKGGDPGTCGKPLPPQFVDGQRQAQRHPGQDR